MLGQVTPKKESIGEVGQPEPRLGGEELQDECGRWTLGLDGALGAGEGDGGGVGGLAGVFKSYRHFCPNVIDACHRKKYFILVDCFSAS